VKFILYTLPTAKIVTFVNSFICYEQNVQESPAIADKPVRRESLRNRAKFTENSHLWSSRSSKVNRKPMYDFLLVNNSNFGRICYRFRDVDA